MSSIWLIVGAFYPSAGVAASRAGGFYTGAGQQAFVVSQVNGKWRTAIEVPGTGALNIGGDAQVSSLSCSSRGTAAAAGSTQTAPASSRRSRSAR